MRVLVVDDNEAAAKTIGWAVEAFGHQMQLAHDGPEAIEVAMAFKPDVMLLDISLPGMSGYEVCKKLRQEPALKHTVFIAQTGWGHEHQRLSAEAGFKHYLLKPVSIEILQDLLSSIAETAGKNAAAQP